MIPNHKKGSGIFLSFAEQECRRGRRLCPIRFAVPERSVQNWYWVKYQFRMFSECYGALKKTSY